MNYYVIADTHFGHEEMVTQFGRPAGYETKIMRSVDLIDKPGNVLIHLGDVCLGKDADWHGWVESLECRTWLVRGTHDRKSNTWYLDHGWDFVANAFYLDIFGKSILFSHTPQSELRCYDLNIHGHFHDVPCERHEVELRAVKNDKQILVSLEQTNYHALNLRKVVEQWDKDRIKEQT